MNYRLGFLGAGNMAEAIARAAIDKGVLVASEIIASDPVEARRQVFEELGMGVTSSNAAAIGQSQQVLIAVKPQQMADAAADLAQNGSEEQVLISIMAGIGSAKLEEAVGRPSRIVRVMPNTPLMSGAGMAGVALGGHAEKGDDELAMQIFSAAGEAIRVDEASIDAITAVSGSGPAYLFYRAEAMHRAATELGLADHAPLLVQQTLYGAAKLLCESDDAPAELRRKVTSPGGTTEAAINHMESQSTQDVIVNAIKAAHARSIELGG